MHSLLIALFLLVQSPGASGGGDAATIFSTIGHSEWCPTGNVNLNLSTGRYSYTAPASRLVCNNRHLQRTVTTGTLPGSSILAVRAAYERAEAQGLRRADCRDGRRDDNIIVSNGGPRILVLTSGARSQAAPDDLSCWTDAAHDLQRLLEDELPGSKETEPPQSPCAQEVGATAAVYRLSELPRDIHDDLPRLAELLGDKIGDSDAPLLQTDAPTGVEADYPTARFVQAILVDDKWFVQLEVSLFAGVRTIGYIRHPDGKFRLSPAHYFGGPACASIRAALSGVRTPGGF